MAIIAMLSDIPLYVQKLLENLTGTDLSEIGTTFSGIFSAVIDLIEKIASFIG